MAMLLVTPSARAELVAELELTSEVYRSGEPIGAFVRLRNNGHIPVDVPSENYVKAEHGNVALLVRGPGETEATKYNYNLVGDLGEAAPHTLRPGGSIYGFIYMYGSPSLNRVLTAKQGTYQIRAEVALNDGVLVSEFHSFSVRGEIPGYEASRNFPIIDMNLLIPATDRSTRRLSGRFPVTGPELVVESDAWFTSYRRYVRDYPRSPLSYYLRLLIADAEAWAFMRRSHSARVRASMVDDPDGPIGARVIANGGRPLVVYPMPNR